MSEYLISFDLDEGTRTETVNGWTIKLTPKTVCEITRCRDCWYYTDKGNGFFTCGHFDSAHAEVEPDGFCKWASRRDA